MCEVHYKYITEESGGGRMRTLLGTMVGVSGRQLRALCAGSGPGQGERDHGDAAAHGAAQPGAAPRPPLAAHLPVHGRLLQGHLERGGASQFKKIQKYKI